MNIFIVADHEPEHPRMMVPSLSQFFEMHLGWGAESEAGQVAKLTGLDFSPYMLFAKEPGQAVWQELEPLVDLTQQFIAALNKEPELHERIRYSAMPQTHAQEQLIRLATEGDKQKMDAFIKEWQHIPDSAFPPDIGYMRKGFLLDDLQQLEKMLAEIKKGGAQKISLIYV